MNREELFEYITKVGDPKKDCGKILSNLHYTHFYLMDRYKKMLGEYDLTSSQSNVLGIIGYYYPKAVALEEIKEMILEPNSDVSRTVTRLVGKNYVEKVINKENRRKVCIKATPRGLKVIKRIEASGKFEKFTSKLSRSEVKTFIKVLAKFRNA
jgi:MarR family 2-MHQ and catechol resistance regulon transcriptional repressor